MLTCNATRVQLFVLNPKLADVRTETGRCNPNPRGARPPLIPPACLHVRPTWGCIVRADGTRTRIPEIDRPVSVHRTPRGSLQVPTRPSVWADPALRPVRFKDKATERTTMEQAVHSHVHYSSRTNGSCGTGGAQPRALRPMRRGGGMSKDNTRVLGPRASASGDVLQREQLVDALKDNTTVGEADRTQGCTGTCTHRTHRVRASARGAAVRRELRGTRSDSLNPKVRASIICTLPTC